MTKIFRLAATADLHCKTTSGGAFRDTFADLAEHADALALCGDLVDCGLPAEAQILLQELSPVLKKNIPILAVFGNHEFESGKADEVQKILTAGGVTVLDGGACEINGIGFAGIKGFSGGFGERVLEPWGEAIIKRFVREAVDEALKLESALARLRTAQRIALLHYSPIAGTVFGEPTEVYPFLGCSRLEEPLERYSVTAAIHGHAHRGSAEGRTKSGVPVFNVAMGVMELASADHCPYRILELPVRQSSS
jgi:Icc-related predicted phosphoesterase